MQARQIATTGTYGYTAVVDDLIRTERVGDTRAQRLTERGLHLEFAELGRGSMGITYRALRLSDQQAVALKVLSIRGLENWKNFELFEREAAVLQRLDHPHIPAYLESFQLEEEGGPVFCLVQSLAPGLSVDAAMAKGWR